MLSPTDLVPLFRLTRDLLAILDDGANPLRASDAATHLVEHLDQRLAAIEAPALDCRAGCAHCCWNWVGATAPEIFLLARTLRDAVKDGLAPLATEIRRNAAAGDRAAREAGQHPCALLDGDRCQAYLARPVVCRTTVSLSVAACITAAQGGPDKIPAPIPFRAERGGHDQCLWAALTASSLSDTSYEIGQALARVIEDPAAEARWLAGEDVFDGVAVDGTADAQTRAFGAVLLRGARALD